MEFTLRKRPGWRRQVAPGREVRGARLTTTTDSPHGWTARSDTWWISMVDGHEVAYSTTRRRADGIAQYWGEG